jgi:hypothetical protein
MPSTGAVEAPLFNIDCWYLGFCEFYHITAYYILPPGLDITIHWAPEEDGKIQVIFAVTFGTPRDYNTGEVVYSGDVGFWHRGKGMKLHWDPLVESILNVVYPHITPTTKQEYFEIRFINRTSRVIIVDVSIWIFEYTVHNFQIFLSMVRGFSKLLRLADAILPDNIDREAAARYLAEFIRAVKSAGG